MGNCFEKAMSNVPCTEQYRDEQEHEERLKKLAEGAVFMKRKFTFGIGTGSESVRVEIDDKNYNSLRWKKVDSENHLGSIALKSVKKVIPQGSLGLSVVSVQGDNMLELEAEDSDTRDSWVTDLQLIIDRVEKQLKGRGSDDKLSAKNRMKKMIQDTTEKKKYWTQRQADLAAREKEAEERKKKFSGVGMKYTAIAMSNRK